MPPDAPDTLDLDRLLPDFDETVFTDEAIDDEFERLQTIPFEDPWLGYELTVPRGWQWEVVDPGTLVSTAHFVPLGLVTSKDRSDTTISVSYIVTPEVRLQDWPWHYAETTGAELLAQVDTDYGGRPAVDTLMRFSHQDGRRFLARTGFYRDGRRLFLVVCAAPEDVFAEVALEFSVVVSSLWLLNPDKQLLVEAVEDYHIETTPAHFVRIREPAWVADAIEDLPHGVYKVNLYRGDPAAPAGTISVGLYVRGLFPELTVKKMVQSRLANLRAAAPKMKIVERSEAIGRLEDHPHFTRVGGYQEFRIRLAADTDVMFHIYVLQHTDFWVAIDLFCDPPDTNRLRWMQNRRHLDIVMQGMRIEYD